MRREQPVHVGRHGLAGGQAAGTRPAVIDRPPPEEALAWRGSTVGLEVVARIGAWRYRHHVSMIKIRAPLQTESTRMSSLTAVAVRCEVV